MAKQTMTIPERPEYNTRGFLIEYDEDDPTIVRIDGVTVSVELLTTMIVNPPLDRFYKFAREGDLVTVKQVASVEILE